MTTKKLLFLIDSLRESDEYIKDIYCEGSCYRFHIFLKKLLPDCFCYINSTKNHVVTFYKGKFFDITGIAKDENFLPLKKSELKMVEKWSFAKNNLLKISECPACEEPFVV